MNQAKLLFLLIAALAFTSCGSDEPRYADPEAHEKTVQQNEQYGPLMVGTWHYENISDTLQKRHLPSLRATSCPEPPSTAGAPGRSSAAGWSR